MKHKQDSLVKHFLLLLLLSLPTLSAAQQRDWEQAVRDVVRLPPSAFPTLPASIRAELEKLNCTIPQTYDANTPVNVVGGKFASPNQVDWAVLCSRNGHSEILVFWGGRSRCPALTRKSPDLNWLQTIGGGRIGYSHSLATVDRKYILDHYEAYGGPKPPPIDHNGLDEGFLGKGSATLYCYRGKWIVLQGAD
jgi:hypothetical protein